MDQGERDYYRMRAAQEEAAANRAEDPAVAEIHRALAVRYLTRSLGEDGEGQDAIMASPSAGGGGDADNSRRTRQSGSA